MIGILTERWNDLLTIAAFAIAAASGIYQVKHYRAQPADLNVLEVIEALHAKKMNQEMGYITDYKLVMRVENAGREATTISSATLTVDGEKLDLERFEDSTEIPVMSDTPRSLPVEAPDERRVPGNDVIQLKYRIEGAPYGESDGEIEGIFRIRTAGGDTTEHTVTFQPRFQ